MLKITSAEFAAKFPHARAFELPSIERPIIEVHKGSGQIYPRTRAAYESTRRMAARLGPRALRALERKYDVYELIAEGN